MVLIEEKRLKELLKIENLFNLLESYGVDNWQGYYSWDDEEELSEEDLNEIIKEYKTLETENI